MIVGNFVVEPFTVTKLENDDHVTCTLVSACSLLFPSTGKKRIADLPMSQQVTL